MTFRQLERIAVLLAALTYLWAVFTLSVEAQTPDGASGDHRSGGSIIVPLARYDALDAGEWIVALGFGQTTEAPPSSCRHGRSAIGPKDIMPGDASTPGSWFDPGMPAPFCETARPSPGVGPYVNERRDGDGRPELLYRPSNNRPTLLTDPGNSWREIRGSRGPVPIAGHRRAGCPSKPAKTAKP